MSSATALLCVKNGRNMRCKIRWNWKGKFFVFFFFFASGGALLSTATKVPKNAVQGGRDAVFPFPLEEPPTLKRRKRGRRARLPSFESPLRGRGRLSNRAFCGGVRRKRQVAAGAAGGYGFPRQCAPQGYLLRGEHWLGMTALRAGGASGGEKETPSGRMVFLFTAGRRFLFYGRFLIRWR